MSIAVVLGPDKAAAGEKDKTRFETGPAASYPARQTNGNVTLAVAAVVETDDQARPAFGKLNPNKYGVLPILVVIQNDSNQAIRTDNLRVDYVAPDGSHVEATPPQDVRFLEGPKKPSSVPGPNPTGIPRIGRHKNPLAAWEIEGRAFSAKMIPAGESASGFFYFQTGHRTGSSLYVTGLREAASGKELLYFEVRLKDVAR